MTAHKHLKQLVRARMLKTGESYASARRQVIRPQAAAPARVRAPWHFPGNIPATTALRTLLAHAGLCAPHTGEPFSEAMVFGIAGGVGAGMFSFVYEAADFASFFVAGRHNWQDDLGYLADATRRLGLEPTIRESSGAKAADSHLRTALADGPCVAWVDMAHLPHRGLPPAMSGGGYHVITVYHLDDQAQSALVGDLADDPVPIPLEALSQARGRIKKQKNRLLSVPAVASSPLDLRGLVREGLTACHAGRTGIGGRVMVNFTLEAFRLWGRRMHGSKDRESWENVFPRGSRLWSGLTGIYDAIENHGTGGGLCRPIFADFLFEAAEATTLDSLRSLGEQYADLGRRWSELAGAALPDDVPAFHEAKRQLTCRAESTVGGGDPSGEDTRRDWARLAELRSEARAQFPLSEADCRSLRSDLQRRILELYEAEVAARAALGSVASAL